MRLVDDFQQLRMESFCQLSSDSFRHWKGGQRAHATDCCIEKCRYPQSGGRILHSTNERHGSVVNEIRTILEEQIEEFLVPVAFGLSHGTYTRSCSTL